MPQEHADHELIAEVLQRKRVKGPEHLWPSCLLSRPTWLVVRRKKKGAPEAGPWLTSLGQIPGSPSIAWAAKPPLFPYFEREACVAETDLA